MSTKERKCRNAKERKRRNAKEHFCIQLHIFETARLGTPNAHCSHGERGVEGIASLNQGVRETAWEGLLEASSPSAEGSALVSGRRDLRDAKAPHSLISFFWKCCLRFT